MQRDDKKAKKYTSSLVLSVPLSREDMAADKTLAEKAEADIFVLTADLSKEREQELMKLLKNLKSDSRLYISVHGSKDGMHAMDAVVSSPFVLAEILSHYDLSKIKRIGLIMCEGDVINPNTGESFAKEFHHLLGKKFEIYLEVSAYTSVVGIFTNVNYPSFLGKKMIKDQEGNEYFAKGSGFKTIYAWTTDKHNGEDKQLMLTQPNVGRQTVVEAKKDFDKVTKKR